MHNLHSYYEVQTFEMNEDDDVTHGTQKHYSSPYQTIIFGHGNEKDVHAPSIGSNTLRTKACKLPDVQNKTNKRMENKIKDWMKVPLQLLMPLNFFQKV